MYHDFGTMTETSASLRTITRLQRQQEALLRMAHLNRDRPRKEVVEEIAQIAAETLLVSQFGVWLYNEERNGIYALCIYEFEKNEFTAGAELFAKDYPRYFEAMSSRKSIIAHDARNDERTSEFTESYLKPGNIYSLLDSSIFVSGESRGVVCCEQQFSVREWQSDEVLFASAVADQVAQVIMDEEKRAVESKLRQVEKMQALGELAGGIAHDFNNQLTAIMGFADLIKMKTNDPGISRYINNVIRTTANAAETVKQLLAFSRKSTLRNDTLDVHDIINELHSMLTHTLGKHIHIHLTLDASHSLVQGDASQLQNALLNIAINARDAMPDGGHIVISTELMRSRQIHPDVQAEMRRHDAYLLVRIQDSGSGISADDMQHIFEPFFTTKGPKEGTGMGLSVSYGTIQHMGGTITVDSEIDKGTCFNLYLPVTYKKKEASEDPYGSGVINLVPKVAAVLVVDDEPDISDIIKEAVTSIGHKAICFNDPLEALEFFKTHVQKIDLVLSDVNMPRMNGYKFFTAVKAISPETKIIMSSGYSDVASADDFMRLGALDFLSKPYRMSTLVNALQKHMA